ncbi:MAG: transcription antitermination factor NusB [Candidatus Aminicenantes bacterium]|nr:transcription antitermination factor NusB [Candidatus Aminicenantes bacterium]
MGQRRKARECALQILFQFEFNAGDPKALVKVYWEHQKASPEVRKYGTWIVEEIIAHGEDIDRAIQAASKNWRLSRMAVIDRNILRIAVCELLYEKTLAPAIIMNEAIEVAKRYSGEESAVFVNGVLDAVGRLLREKADEPGTAAGPGKAGEHD